MADTAGFEPAICGLGGRRLIQLGHVSNRLGEAFFQQPIANRNHPKVTYTCNSWPRTMSSQAAKKVIPGKESGLPNPYSKDFDRAEDSISNTMLDYESAERHRIKYGRLASNSVVLMTRRVAGLLMAMTCLLYTSPSPRDISGSRMPSSA